MGRETIAVVLLLHFIDSLLNGEVIGFCYFIDAFVEIVEDLLLRKTAYCSELIIKTVVLDIVQFAEDTELRELRDAREENEAQQSFVGLQRTEEVAHDTANLCL